MRKLVVAGQGKLERNAEALDRHDGDTADSGAYRQIDHRVALSVDGRYLVNHDSREYGDYEAINHETCSLVSDSPLPSRTHILSTSSSPTWLQGMIQQLVDVLQWLVWRRMQHDDHTSNKTDRTAYSP
jgi:hypothetical protein